MYPKSLNACSQIYPKTPLYLTSKSTRFTVLYDCLPNFQARSLEVMPLTSREIVRNHNHNYSILISLPSYAGMINSMCNSEHQINSIYNSEQQLDSEALSSVYDFYDEIYLQTSSSL